MLWTLALLTVLAAVVEARPPQKSHPMAGGRRYQWAMADGACVSGRLVLPHTPSAPHSAQQAHCKPHKSPTQARPAGPCLLPFGT